jgi:hypothetical protein
MKAKKALKIVLIAIPILLIVAVVVVIFMLDGLVKTSVETVMPEVTGTPVTLESVSLSPLSGRGELGGFIIGNPEGFKTDSAFKLGNVVVDVDVSSLMSDTIVIEEITINAPQVTFEVELPSFKSNISAIQKNVDKFAGTPAEEALKPEEKDKGPGKKMKIKLFVLKGATVSVSTPLLGGKKLTVPLPPIRLENIGGGDDDEGKSIGEVAKAIFDPLTGSIENVAKEALSKAKDLLADGGKVLGQIGDTAAEAGRGAVKEAGNVLKGGKEAGKGLIKGVGEIFKK